jgi:hypothetical protein
MTWVESQVEVKRGRVWERVHTELLLGSERPPSSHKLRNAREKNLPVQLRRTQQRSCVPAPYSFPKAFKDAGSASGRSHGPEEHPWHQGHDDQDR